MKLYVTRHGETPMNAAHRVCGLTNIDLTLLWHNSNPSGNPYHQSLYIKLLKGLRHYTKHA